MRKQYTEEDYINECKKKNLEYVGFHKEKGGTTMIDFICKKHYDKGVQSKPWSHFRSYTYGCTYCSGRGKTNADIEKDIKDKNVQLISKYIGNEKPIKCKCRVCGNIWTTLPKVLVTNGSGCPVCGKIKAVKAETKTIDQFISEMKLVNDDIEILGDYKNTHTKIKCRCKICGTIWYGYPANLLNKSAGCPGCNISDGEKLMIDTLRKIGVNVKQQHTIAGCKLKKRLRFDGFDLENNIAFEFNGEQHYRPVDFAGKGEEWAINEFETTQKRDAVKRDYCAKNNIPIITVPYWEKENIEEFLIKKLKEVKQKSA